MDALELWAESIREHLATDKSHDWSGELTQLDAILTTRQVDDDQAARDEYSAVCDVIDRAKNDGRSLDTDEYAGMIYNALAPARRPLVEALTRYDDNEAAYEPDGNGYERWEDEKLTTADLLADAARNLLKP